MILSSSGFLGIGTANPQAKLHVKGTAGTDGILFPDGSLQTSAFNQNSGWSTQGNSGTNPATHFIGTKDNKDVVFKRNSTEVMKLTQNPSFLFPIPILMVNGHIELIDHLIFNSTTTHGVINWPSGKNLYFRTNAVSGDVSNFSTKMTILSNGTVGIGTAIPEEQLDVRGRVLIGGSDLILGKYDGRIQKNNTENRALVHSSVNSQSDNLIINFNGDFEDGVEIQGTKTTIFGKLGVGTNNPSTELHISAFGNPTLTITSSNGSSQTRLMSVTSNGYPESQIQYVGRFSLVEPISGNVRFVVAEDGRVRVNNEISCKQLRVETNWSDFVFEEDFKRLGIEAKEQFYTQHKHLPNVPPAQEIETDGLDIGNVMKGMMQNIEEDRLDITELYKRILKLEEENKTLKTLLIQK